MCQAANDKCKNVNNKRRRRPKSRKYQNSWEKENPNTLGILEVQTIKQKLKKASEIVPQMNEKASRKLCSKNLIKAINT